MISIYSPDHALHDPPFEFLDGALVPVFESPRRAEIISAAIVRAGLGPLVTPRSFGLEPIRAVHSDEYLAYLEHIYDQWVAAGGAPESVMPGTLAVRWMERPCPNPIATPGYYCFDLSAPIVAGTYAAARAAANVALTGAALLQQGQRAAYALCRPPGHHAGRDLYGGYCYLNNAAIAAQALLAGNWWQGNTAPRRVAILDIDYHHGNGTQQIFYERDDVLFVSIHADPARQYPYFAGYADECGAGAGSGYNLNIPLEAD
ncbi:MAG TPA: histone deacetylase family protein, partial [Roseiflexaceae bacterium]|nr:histone deacetylase family protein [Roseiflexaceae bacterium]